MLSTAGFAQPAGCAGAEQCSAKPPLRPAPTFCVAYCEAFLTAPVVNNHLHPRQVLRELEKAMPPDVMLSTNIGNINSVANS